LTFAFTQYVVPVGRSCAIGRTCIRPFVVIDVDAWKFETFLEIQTYTYSMSRMICGTSWYTACEASLHFIDIGYMYTIYV